MTKEVILLLKEVKKQWLHKKEWLIILFIYLKINLIPTFYGMQKYDLNKMDQIDPPANFQLDYLNHKNKVIIYIHKIWEEIFFILDVN